MIYSEMGIGNGAFVSTEIERKRMKLESTVG